MAIYQGNVYIIFGVLPCDISGSDWEFGARMM